MKIQHFQINTPVNILGYNTSRVMIV